MCQEKKSRNTNVRNVTKASNLFNISDAKSWKSLGSSLIMTNIQFKIKTWILRSKAILCMFKFYIFLHGFSLLFNNISRMHSVNFRGDYITTSRFFLNNIYDIVHKSWNYFFYKFNTLIIHQLCSIITLRVSLTPI